MRGKSRGGGGGSLAWPDPLPIVCYSRYIGSVWPRETYQGPGGL